MCGSVVALIDNDVAKVIRRKCLQIPAQKLDRGADDKLLRVTMVLKEFTNRHFRPQPVKLSDCLVQEFLRMSEEQGAFPYLFRILHGCYGFPSASSLIQHGNGLVLLAHLCKVLQSLSLMVFENKYLFLLLRHPVFHQEQLRGVTEKGNLLIFDPVRGAENLPVCPSEDFPALVHHAVLLEEVVLVFVFRHFGWIMPSHAVDFNGNSTLRTAKCVINGAVLTVAMW